MEDLENELNELEERKRAAIERIRACGRLKHFKRFFERRGEVELLQWVEAYTGEIPVDTSSDSEEEGLQKEYSNDKIMIREIGHCEFSGLGNEVTTIKNLEILSADSPQKVLAKVQIAISVTRITDDPFTLLLEFRNGKLHVVPVLQSANDILRKINRGTMTEDVKDKNKNQKIPEENQVERKKSNIQNERIKEEEVIKEGTDKRNTKTCGVKKRKIYKQEIDKELRIELKRLTEEEKKKYIKK